MFECLCVYVCNPASKHSNTLRIMKCRPGCGACCIAPSISSRIPGMPNGKAAGEACIHLSDDLLCLIFHDPARPKACDEFTASEEHCGNSQAEALRILSELEACTSVFENRH